MLGRSLLVVVTASLMSAIPLRADVVQDWSDIALDAIRADRTAPPKAARGLALVHVAMFDAINAIVDEYEPYLDLGLTPPSNASIEAAAGVAAHDILVALYPAQQQTFDDALNALLESLGSSRAVDAGFDVGTAVAAALWDSRQGDGSDEMVTYVVGNDPGDWQPTPPGFVQSPALPQWGAVKPFCLGDVAALRRPGPPPLTSHEYATAFNEVKSLGSKTSTTRTADETQIALFWVDGPGTATPPGHWFQIARDVANQQGISTLERARLFALLGLAVCDAGICSWDNKYAYEFWRPVTGIREADTDGNPDTEADAAWESLIPTPAFPAYTSGHSTFSGAGAKILASFFGQDAVAFTTSSDDVPGVSRSYTRFSQAANEAGRSRIYGGIHWEFDNQDGLSSGRELGVFVYDNFLRPKADEPIPTPSLCGFIGLVPFTLTVLALAGLKRGWRQR